MASRRLPEQEVSDDRNLQNPLQDSTQAEIAHALRNVLFPSMAELQSCLEPLIRRVVQEEVPSIIERHLCQRTTLTLTERYGARAFQLCFMDKLPSTIYTSSRLTAKDGAPIEIALCDATSQNSIVRNAPQSFTKIEICPLDGEFSSDDWTANEFNARIVRERENRPPLLNGDKFVVLENGTGFISNINFTDNSCWMRSGKFRIGARVVDSGAAINIREARSDTFRVMDSRGEAYKKYDYPSLNDPIWRLRKIAKNGKTYKHLSSNGIDTVKDLLHLRKKNPALFEQIFCSIPKKSKETIIEHAKACREDPTEGPSSVSPLNDFMAIDEPLPNSSMNSFATSLQVQAAAGQSSNPDQGLQQFVTADQKELWEVFSQTYAPTSHIGGVHNSQVGSDEMADWIRWMPSTPIEEGIGSEMYIGGISSQTNYNLPSTGNGSYIGSGDHSSSPLPWYAGHASSSGGNRRTLWPKIRNVLKWVGLYAAKRNQIKLFPIPHNSS